MKVITSKNKSKLSNNKTPYYGYFIKINAHEIRLCATVSYKRRWNGERVKDNMILEALKKKKGRGNRMVV